MAIILENKQIAPRIYLLEAVPDPDMVAPLPGQFYMVRTWDRFPLLSRPISVFDYDQEQDRIKFLYQVVGRGTQMLSQIAVTSNILLDGPYGVGFPAVDKDVVLVGGGIGIAPLYYAAKRQRELFENRSIRAYLGYSQIPFGMTYFQRICNHLTYDVGNLITDNVVIRPDETVFCCGPEAMMRTVSATVPPENDVFLSFEGRMGCGVGACLGCVKNVPICYEKTRTGRGLTLMNVRENSVRLCTDGPVFKRQVFS